MQTKKITGMMMAAAGLTLSAHAETTIRLKNSSDAWVTVSDLIVWDWDGNAHEILKPFDQRDDVIFPPDSQDTFTTELEPSDIARVAVSYPDLIAGQTEEIEWVVDNLYDSITLNATFFRAEDGSVPLHTYAGDDEAARFNLPEGTRIRFSGGQSSEVPGLEVGTFFDYDEGYVGGFYTGWAVVSVNNLEVQLLDTDSCPADLDGDGDIDAIDFFSFLDAFESGDADVCDLDGDGDCDAIDFFTYLDYFSMGC